MDKPSVKTIKVRVQKRVLEMAKSLRDEEYRIMIRVPLPDNYFVKLRHAYNGNVISIIGNYNTEVVRLFRNGKLRHKEKV